MLAFLRIPFMKRNLKYTIPALILVAGAAFGFRYVQSATSEKESLVMRLVAEALQGVHYQPRAVDDAFSEDVFTAYLELLDGEKRFLYLSDYDRLAKHRLKLDTTSPVETSVFLKSLRRSGTSAAPKPAVATRAFWLSRST